MTWLNSRGKVLALAVFWLMMAAWWTYLGLDSLRSGSQMKGIVSLTGAAFALVAAVLRTITLRRMSKAFAADSR